MNLQCQLKFTIIIISFYILFLGCAVEVGNPTETGTSKGLINISIADAPVDSATSFKVFIANAFVFNSKGESVQISLTKDKKTPLDLLALQNGKQEKIVQKNQLEKGIYNGVVIEFSPEHDSLLELKDGRVIKVPYTSPDHRKIFLPQEFYIENDKITNLLIHLDLRKSIYSKTQKEFEDLVFDPKAELLHGTSPSIKGSYRQNNALVCAYLYQSKYEVISPELYFPDKSLKSEPTNQKTEETPKKPFSLNDPHTKPVVPTKENAEPISEEDRAIIEQKILAEKAAQEISVEDIKMEGKTSLPSFETKESITFDTKSSCLNAFTTAFVENGKFTLRYLQPGRYLLRVFNQDSTFEDIYKEIVVQDLDIDLDAK